MKSIINKSIININLDKFIITYIKLFDNMTDNTRSTYINFNIALI